MRDTYREVDADGRLGAWTVSRRTRSSSSCPTTASRRFRRGANLNAWLEQHGYLRSSTPSRRDRYEWLEGIDWRRTRAFAIGLNSLYINVRGRERDGIVAPEERAGAGAGDRRAALAAGAIRRTASPS